MKAGVLIQDRYELKEVLGRGGMAEVWLAHDNRLQRPVAIKFLARHFGEDPEYLVRFFSEAQAVARIQHPGVVTVLDFGQIDDHPFLVMYYVAGGSLADVVGTPMPPERALPIVEHMADAAGAAHKLGIVHRDIKPGNILIDDEGKPRLADFGIASSEGAEHLTATGTAVGSPHYVSPEQAQGAPTSPRSDVYALGVVLYELLTGLKPFQGNVPEIVLAHVEKMPAPPSEHVNAIGPDIDALVLRCLAKDAGDRFADGTEMAQAIHALGIGNSTVAVPAADDRTSMLPTGSGDADGSHTSPLDISDPPPTSRSASGRLPIRAGALAALLVTLLAVGLGLVLFGGDATEPARGSEGNPHPRVENGAKTTEDSTEDAGSSGTSDGSTPSAPDEEPEVDEDADDVTNGDEDDDEEDDEVVDPEVTPTPSASPSPEPSPVETDGE